MSHTANGIISAPVDLVGDVAAVLGVSTYDVAYLCGNAHGKINKWAKYKPERLVPGTSSPPHQQPGILALEARKNNNFGLSPAEVYSSISDFAYAVISKQFKSGWDYYPPQPGTDWCRLTDFDGYNHNALSPFGTLMTHTYTLTQSTLNTLVIPATVPNTNDTSAVSAMELNGKYLVKDWYFGVLLINKYRYFAATTQIKLSQGGNGVGGWQVDFGWINPSYAGLYMAVPFLASNTLTNGGATPSGLQIVGAGSSGVEITLQTTSDQYVPSASGSYPSANSKTLNYIVSINNTTSSSKTFASVELQGATNMSGANQTTLKNFGSVTVAANSRWQQTGSVEAPSAGYYQALRLIYSGNSSTKWVTVQLGANTDT